MDLSRILKTPHTSEQIGTLWNAYHTSKSATGKGYLSAVIPRTTYESFLPMAKKYPSFILPLPRPDAQVETSPENSNSSNPYEFYYMEWGHHHSPAVPSENPSDLFSSSKTSQNPPYTTVIFTPLQEYKLRQSFALPHLILTHYTDLAHTHDVVLMRGELTPSTNDPGRFLLSPGAAQILAFGLQRFYLPDQDKRRRDLLTTFHEKPQEFSWEELISAAEIL
jgi:ATP synthase mitochondrial F1 complex assembly factor 1